MQNSTRSIIDKLNFKKYPERLILNKPDDITDFEGVDYDTTIQKQQYDLIMVFIFSLEEFAMHVKEVIDRQLVKDNGFLYFAYPKKNNKQYEQYIERDDIYNQNYYNEEGFVHNSTLKFAKMVSLNDVFTVVGMKSTPVKKSSSKPSQRVDDYIEKIADIKAYLKANEEILMIYEGLTPGYQKDWARFVYSAKRKETQDKRLQQMEQVLADGHKTMDLYRASNR